MNRIILNMIAVTSAICTLQLHPFNNGKTFYAQRSQSVNAARELVGWYWGINRYDVGDYYGNFFSAFEFTRTFQARHIADYFFGTDVLTFTGSRVPNRSPNDILADYFGLPTDFSSTVLVTPRVINALIDFDWYAGLDAWCDGIYFRVHAPLVYTRWGLNLEECSEYPGVNNYPAGYMAPVLINRSEMARSVTQALTGTVSFGDFHRLRFGKVDGNRYLVALSEIQVAFGWNMINNENYHFGINARGSIPTGTRPKGIYLFEPIVGNGHHGELGIGFTGHSVKWYCNDEWMVGLYGDLNLTHLFANKQRRSFDFIGHGAGSRYILMEDMGPAQQGYAVGGVQAEFQYQGNILPGINQTTLDCVISAAIQLDMAVMLTWQHKHINVDLGYNLWMRSAEQLNSRDCFPNNRFALKGDAQVYGFITGTDQAVKLNATQSTPAQGGMMGRVRIESGQGQGSATQLFTNSNADNAGFATFDGVDLDQSFAPDGIINTGLDAADISPVNGSNPPVLLSNCDIDDFSALSGSTMTNKFFCYFGYSFVNVERATPYVGFGGEIELDGAATRIAKNSFSQWGIWLKGGVAY